MIVSSNFEVTYNILAIDFASCSSLGYPDSVGWQHRLAPHVDNIQKLTKWSVTLPSKTQEYSCSCVSRGHSANSRPNLKTDTRLV